MIDAAKVRAYQSLRETGKEFHAKVMNVIPKDVLISTAMELGLWHKGVLVADEQAFLVRSVPLVFWTPAASS